MRGSSSREHFSRAGAIQGGGSWQHSGCGRRGCSDDSQSAAIAVGPSGRNHLQERDIIPEHLQRGKCLLGRVICISTMRFSVKLTAN